MANWWFDEVNPDGRADGRVHVDRVHRGYPSPGSGRHRNTADRTGTDQSSGKPDGDGDDSPGDGADTAAGSGSGFGVAGALVGVSVGLARWVRRDDE